MYAVFYQDKRGASRGQVCETEQELEKILERLRRANRPARVVDSDGRDVGRVADGNWFYEQGH